MTATDRELAVPPVDAAPRPDRGGALSFSVVGAIFGGLLVLGLTLGFVIHRSYVGFERAAAYHVPPDTSLVVRWDVEKVSLFEPTRRFLLPLLDFPEVLSVPPPKAGAQAGKPRPVTRRDRFAERSGTMLGRDLREVVALFGPGEGDWAVVLAGSFAAGDPMPAVAQTLAEEGRTARTIGPDRLVAGGVSLGRASDGVVVLASSPARLEATLARRAPLPEVPREGAGAVRLGPARGGVPAPVVEALGSLGDVRAVTGAAHWGSPLAVELELVFAGPPPAGASERVRALAGQLLGADLARLERESAPLSVQSAGNQTLRIRLLLDDPALEGLAKRAADAVMQSVGPRAGAGNGL